MLYERTALSKLPEKTIEIQLKELKEKDKMTPELVFRDPYVLDFLELSDTYISILSFLKMASLFLVNNI